MKPNIAIIIDYENFGESDNQGGSETWAIEMSRQFIKNGYNVFLFTLNPIWSWSPSNIQFIPIHHLGSMLTYIKFDYIFISRYVFKDTVNLLEDYPLHKNIYWVAHDTIIMMDNELLTYEKILENDILKNHLNKIICMSEFGKENIKVLTNIPDEYFEVIGNGLNTEFFKQHKDIYKDNNLFWSSRYERGLELVVDNILPILQRDYPNMKIYVAQYENNLPDELKNNPNIVFLGQLNKVELYTEMQRHKVMFYPNFYPETFCITVIEAAMNDEEIIVPLVHGPATIFNTLTSAFDKFDCEYSLAECNKIASEIKYRLENYNDKNRIIIRNLIKENIINNYSWESIYNKYKERILK